MTGGTVHCALANTVDSVYYGNPQDISDHRGSVIIESRMCY